MSQCRMDALTQAVVAGEINSVEALQTAFMRIQSYHDEDSWAWVRHQARESLQLNLDQATCEQIADCVSRFCEEQQKFLRLILLDAEREYDEASRTGFGLGGDAQSAEQDFAAVRGVLAQNGFVKQLTTEIESLPRRCEALRQRLMAMLQNL